MNTVKTTPSDRRTAAYRWGWGAATLAVAAGLVFGAACGTSSSPTVRSA